MQRRLPAGDVQEAFQAPQPGAQPAGLGHEAIAHDEDAPVRRSPGREHALQEGDAIKSATHRSQTASLHPCTRIGMRAFSSCQAHPATGFSSTHAEGYPCIASSMACRESRPVVHNHGRQALVRLRLNEDRQRTRTKSDSSRTAHENGVSYVSMSRGSIGRR